MPEQAKCRGKSYEAILTFSIFAFITANKRFPKDIERMITKNGAINGLKPDYLTVTNNLCISCPLFTENEVQNKTGFKCTPKCVIKNRGSKEIYFDVKPHITKEP